jgi:hypothetical protein
MTFWNGTRFRMSSSTSKANVPSADGARDVVTLDAAQWVIVMGNGAACGFPRAGSDSYAVSLQMAQVEWY